MRHMRAADMPHAHTMLLMITLRLFIDVFMPIISMPRRRLLYAAIALLLFAADTLMRRSVFHADATLLPLLMPLRYAMQKRR